MNAKPYTEEDWQKECATGEDTDGDRMTALFQQVASLKEALEVCIGLIIEQECEHLQLKEPGVDNIIPFETTPEQRILIPKYMSFMYRSGVGLEFCVKAGRLATKDQGVYDLMELWYNEWDEAEKLDVEYQLYKSVRDYELE